jgi:predicted enzyme related to lactoylglutathione lyase
MTHTLEDMIVATSVLGGILTGSTDPERLRSWYRAAFAPDQPEEGSLDVGGVLVFNKRSDVADANAEPGRTIINVHVEDAREAVTRLNDAGVTWLTELERRPGGLFATLVDPDGGSVQIIEFNRGSAR